MMGTESLLFLVPTARNALNLDHYVRLIGIIIHMFELYVELLVFHFGCSIMLIGVII